MVYPEFELTTSGVAQRRSKQLRTNDKLMLFP